jgi:hypothetical protein
VLLLDERIAADGRHSQTWATCDGERVVLHDDGAMIGALPIAVVDHVMRRYGRVLDAEIALEGDSLACGGWTLRRLRHRAAVDADGRDYLVWQRPDAEPLACLATSVAGALRFLIHRDSLRNLRREPP